MTTGEFTRLSTAAEELVKAAMSQAESAASADLLKSVNAINESIKDLKVTLETNRSEISELKKVVKSRAEQDRLDWAITNSEACSFYYYYSTAEYPKSSSLLVKHILLKFKRGKGMYIGQSFYKDNYFSLKTDSEREESHEKFLDALVSQIHDLTGVEPGLEVADDGHYICSSLTELPSDPPTSSNLISSFSLNSCPQRIFK